MRKGEFDLTGKAIDCRDLPEVGDAGKEIFRALKVACDGFDNPNFANFRDLHDFQYLAKDVCDNDYVVAHKPIDREVIKLSDVLGQAAIDAAMDGATIVFEGDVVPSGNIVRYWADGAKEMVSMVNPLNVSVNKDVIAYKIIEENPTIESRVLSEKMGFKELCPMCSPTEWQEREAETYDDLRDAHLELIQDSMAKDIEIESLKSRIKELERARNDAKAALDV